jgi:flagellar biosynthesis protein FliR
VQLFFAAVQAAGQMIDMAGAFASASLYDPFSNASSTPMGRVFQIVSITILFVIDGHLMLVRGLMASFEAAPLDRAADSTAGRVPGPRRHHLLRRCRPDRLPDAGRPVPRRGLLGLLTRAAPQINILVIGFNVKVLVLIFLGGLTLACCRERSNASSSSRSWPPRAWFGG